MFRIRLLVLMGLILLGGRAVHAKGPRTRDVWYVCSYQGQRFGYLHRTVTKLPDENFRYTVDGRWLVDFLGSKQELTQQGEYIVTPTYAPVSLHAEREQSSGRTSCEGSVQGKEFVLTFTRGDMQQRRTLDLSDRTIMGVCLDDWLNDVPLETKTTSVKLIDDELWNIIPARATRVVGKGTTTGWDVILGEVSEGTFWFDNNGISIETELTVPRMHLKRCTQDQAKDLEYLSGKGRYVLSFPIKKQIPPPERLKTMIVKLSWRDVPFEALHLEDYRQHVVRRSGDDGSHKVAVKLSSPGPIAAKTTYPINEPGFEQYLGETFFIKPQDEAVVAAAREASGGAETAMEAVKRLSEWTFKYIKPSLIAETLTAPEILECKQGKCSEYTILFASLARSLGIPTRIALGVRMAGSMWAGHLWNEVYVGRWIPVDATANEVGESLSLVKFTHSDTTLGTQRVRWGLTDSLDISIESFEVLPSSLGKEFETGIRGGVYTNVDYACRITAPSEDWRIKDQSAGSATIILLKNRKLNATMYFVAFPLPGNVGAKVLIDARLAQTKTQVEDFQTLENQPCKVGTAAGHTARFSHKSPRDKKKKIVTSEVIWSHGSSGYILKLTGKESSHDKGIPGFQKTLKSFQYLDKK